MLAKEAVGKMLYANEAAGNRECRQLKTSLDIIQDIMQRKKIINLTKYVYFIYYRFFYLTVKSQSRD